MHKPGYTALAVLLAAALLAPGVSARSETKSFIAGNGALYLPTVAGEAGGVRFALQNGETLVDILVSQPAVVGYTFQDGSRKVYGYGAFCTSGSLDIPEGATELVVFVGSDTVNGLPVWAKPMKCGVAVAPVAGTVTATFS
ncbi:MAG TPA: hypothetical protein VNZ52_05410 [Candidatus Thermoplasmatota archaeon]|nr:hypothetical protein [Candidatus Thermoplasmatota archaeon]